jgi:hypothetical protein
MRRSVIARLLVFAIALSTSVLGNAAVSAASPSDDEAAIRAQVEKYREAFEARNVGAIMSNYAPGSQLFVFDAIPPREYASADAYRRDWQGLLAFFPGPIKDRISELNITVAGVSGRRRHRQSRSYVEAVGARSAAATAAERDDTRSFA